MGEVNVNLKQLQQVVKRLQELCETQVKLSLLKGSLAEAVKELEMMDGAVGDVVSYPQYTKDLLKRFMEIGYLTYKRNRKTASIILLECAKGLANISLSVVKVNPDTDGAPSSPVETVSPPQGGQELEEKETATPPCYELEPCCSCSDCR